MRLGLIVNLRSGLDFGRKFSEIREMGLTSCQIVCWDPALIKDLSLAQSLRQSAHEHGIFISAFWCGYGGKVVWDFYEGQKTIGLVPPLEREERLATLIQGASFAEELHTANLVTHVGFLPENPYDPNYEGTLASLRKLVAVCQGKGLHFLFETGQETPVTLLRAIEDLGTDNVGINLDPANLVLYGKANPLDALDVFGRYVREMHGKDGLYPTNGHFLGGETPLGEGKVDFPALLKKLKQIGYAGDITIEREIAEGPNQREDILRAKAYLEKILGDLAWQN
jgi:L-ribulose-5-phosphate 3-epimerase